MGDAPETWEIPPEVLEAIRLAARERFPSEACGLLVGLRGVPRIVEAIEFPNVHPGDGGRAYAIDPLGAARFETGLPAPRSVVGSFHSHVGSTSEPSETDAAQALPGWVYLIQAMRDWEPTELRAWRRSPDGFRPLALALEKC